MGPADLMETELRIAYVELHDRMEQTARIASFWCDLAQHYARLLDGRPRIDPLADLFPITGPGRVADPSSLPRGSAGPLSRGNGA
jgi:hypothetical protein